MTEAHENLSHKQFVQHRAVFAEAVQAPFLALEVRYLVASIYFTFYKESAYE